ncbi:MULTISPECIES: RibD family protein [Rhodomicrobium]|uniref:RibD family protein n=1 Tax=Rhodomicrobium TaxID=1068 RepID=UPI000B4AB4DC|nr:MULTISPECIES: RibD family protein [Rhodomicrobium]
MNNDPTSALDPIAASDPARPYVVAQLGQSLDGRIATPTGASKYINGPSALDFLHRLRASVDAVVVGIGTVIADDPLLTVRRVEGRSPARVVIDPNGRLPTGAKCLSDDGTAIYVVTPLKNCDSPAASTICVDAGPDGLDPHAIVRALHKAGLRRILIEGGAKTVSRFLAAGAVDRLYLLVAPMILGSGQTGLELPPIEEVDEALTPVTRSYALGGGDVLFDCCFKS